MAHNESHTLVPQAQIWILIYSNDTFVRLSPRSYVYSDMLVEGHLVYLFEDQIN